MSGCRALLRLLPLNLYVSVCIHKDSKRFHVRLIGLQEDVQRYKRTGNRDGEARCKRQLDRLMPKDPAQLRLLGEALLRRSGRTRGRREFAVTRFS
jgi:hypothetical protein